MKKIDLHVHTNFSDGLYSPEEVVELAKDREYDVIAIADHDNIDGYLQVKDYAENLDLELIPGVEISTLERGRDVHVLAYNFDIENEELLELMRKIYNSRFSRAEQIIEKLNERNIVIDIEKVKSFAGRNNYLGRPHICRALIEEGYCNDKYEAFDSYLGEHCFAYVPKFSPSAKEAIEVIHKAGGIAILAHPYTLGDDSMIYDIISYGVDGMEVFYAKCNDETIYHYNEIAKENGLIRTGGSDFHGDGLDMDIFGTYSAPEKVLREMNRGRNE
ncbi:MAG: PHP domain-containing protein [Candidatus Cloacimonetes bacterium]|nr:PHP domain-containing protein [Candidatus Cloacimonadota bacterium]MCF7813073.1 PHP domain-containing protein [Candidatus Cloacimonadota bacterium]MCF7867186.1 PHP domain-containing protein [Candidatus Cloacimonadota bacterium]MCF7882630.1 PHP domain-containing protein [Candidatus Cloacimonadota bacterium]